MKNIIITGGELFNKGAQAMTFIAVSELKKRFPNHEILVLSEMDNRRPEAEKKQYAFKFFGWFPVKFARIQNKPLQKLAYRIKSNEYRKFEHIYSNCDAMVDISGYALASSFDKQYYTEYLNHLEIAKAFGIPVYIMSQSFGPFDFKDANTLARIHRLMSYPKVIMAREQEGFDLLTKELGLTNVSLCEDVVLNSKGEDLSAVFSGQPVLNLPNIQSNSAAVIPNAMTEKCCERSAILELYKSLISKLLEVKDNVYLIRHSDMDLELSRDIKAMFTDSDRVVLLENDFQCYEYSALVKSFDFVVASRFHSIVHAYKNGIPCVALGWATKYHDLLTEFGQQKYMIDVREELVEKDVLDCVNYLCANFCKEKEVILQHLAEVQSENIFDKIEL